MTAKADARHVWLGQVLLGTTISFLASVGLRMIVRYWKRVKIGWDDMALLWAALWNVFGNGLIYAMWLEGLGSHASAVSKDQLIMINKIGLLGELMYSFINAWIKVSILLTYYRIFDCDLVFKKWAIGLSTLIFSWLSIMIGTTIFTCVPVQKFWHPDLPGYCRPRLGIWIPNAFISIGTYVGILILPIPWVWGLHQTRIQKIGLTVTFGLGCLVIAMSIARTYSLFQFDPRNIAYSLAYPIGWSAIELAAGIICACLPTWRPIFTYMTTKLTRSTTNSSNPSPNPPPYEASRMQLRDLRRLSGVADFSYHEYLRSAQDSPNLNGGDNKSAAWTSTNTERFFDAESSSNSRTRSTTTSTATLVEEE